MPDVGSISVDYYRAEQTNTNGWWQQVSKGLKLFWLYAISEIYHANQPIII